MGSKFSVGRSAIKNVLDSYTPNKPRKPLFLDVMHTCPVSYKCIGCPSLNLSSPSSVLFPLRTRAKYDSEETLVPLSFPPFPTFSGRLTEQRETRSQRSEGEEKFGQEVHPPWLLGWNPTINLPSSASDLNRSILQLNCVSISLLKEGANSIT